MAKCNTCGMSAGAFRLECRDCEHKRIGQEQEQEQEAESRRLNALKERYVHSAFRAVEKAMSQGKSPILFNMVSVEIDTNIDGEMIGAVSFERLCGMGIDGWEVVESIPRTFASALTNVQSGNEQHAGGMGGNVIGSYVLLKLTVTETMLQENPETIREALEAQWLVEQGL